MNETIVATIITSVCTLVGVIITVSVTNHKRKIENEITLQRQQEQIDEIKEQLEKHNNYAVKIPLIEKDISYIRESIGEIKKKVGA